MIIRGNIRLVSTNTFDVKNFGMKEARTTGSMVSGSSVITVADPSLFNVNDRIIVEIGGSSGLGILGTDDVGGGWPNRRYASTSAMNADTGQPNDMKAGVNGTVYESVGGVWSQFSQPIIIGQATSYTNYYQKLIIPKALCNCYVVSKSGNQLTLSKSATVNTTNANVYFDNAVILTNLLSATYTIPTTFLLTGHFAVGSKIHFVGSNVSLRGIGSRDCSLFSPKGAPSTDIIFVGNNGVGMSDFGIIGNAKGSGGFGFHWEQVLGAESAMTDSTDTPYYPEGIRAELCDNVIIERLYVKDVFQHVGLSLSTSSLVQDCELELSEGHYLYIAWGFQSADGINNTFRRNIVTSPKLVPAFESFSDSGCTFDDCHATNGYFSFNSASDFTMLNCSQTIQANTRAYNNWGHPNSPLVNVNNNIARGGSLGNIVNHQMTIEGFMSADNDQTRGIVVNSENSGITITGGFYHGVNANPISTTTQGQPNGIYSVGTGTIVDGFEATGNIYNPGGTPTGFIHGNISVANGEIKNSTAANIVINSGVILGTGSEANIGTITPV